MITRLIYRHDHDPGIAEFFMRPITQCILRLPYLLRREKNIWTEIAEIRNILAHVKEKRKLIKTLDQGYDLWDRLITDQPRDHINLVKEYELVHRFHRAFDITHFGIHRYKLNLVLFKRVRIESK